MHSKPLLPAPLLVDAGFSPLTQASSGDSYYPGWPLIGGGVCDILPFLIPVDNTRTNLRLLLIDAGHWQLVKTPPPEEEKLGGYDLVLFGLFCLLPDGGSQSPAPAASEVEAPLPTLAPSSLAELARQMDAAALPEKTAGTEFFEGRGSHCRSDDQDSALAFLRRVRDTGLGEAKAKTLANNRLDLLDACGQEQEELGGVLAQGVESAAGKAFVTYLEIVANFYSSRFDEAEQGFKVLQDVSQPWLKETALYPQTRTLLNVARRSAFDDMGFLELRNVDKTRLGRIRNAFEVYLQAYPKGLYAASAKGLQRRVHWLVGDQKLLARDCVVQSAEAEQGQCNMALEDLVQEVNNRLLTGIQLGDTRTSLLLAMADLVQVCVHDPPTSRDFTWETPQAQQANFATHPELFAYLQAAYRFYVDQDPAKTLEVLPQEVGGFDYIGFSQQTLHRPVLERQEDWRATGAFRLESLLQVAQSYQKGQLQLALALNYERSSQLEKVFAGGLSVQESLLCSILLRDITDTVLLRRQVKQGATAEEHDSALFTLLYKDLRRSRFADPGKDFALLGEIPSRTKLGISLGYVYGIGNSLELLRWKGDKTESGYICPAIAESAAVLAADDKDPKGLNCLDELILRNGLDGMLLDSQPEANELGGIPSGFEGVVYSRLDGYRLVMGNPKASHEGKVHALLRAVNCFASAGYNTYGQQDIPQAERRQWFCTPKPTYADSSWVKELKYYW